MRDLAIDPAIATSDDTLLGDRAFGSDTGAPADDRLGASRRIVAIVNPATHGNAAAIVDLLRRHAPADADLDVRLTPAAGTTTALTHEALAGSARAVVAVWALGLRFAWRAHLFERFLGLDMRLTASPHTEGLPPHPPTVRASG